MEITSIAVTVASIFLFVTVKAQDRYSVSNSLNEFSINLLETTNSLLQDSVNIALSPYSVWTLLTIISEGALDNTLIELENVLKLPRNKAPVRTSFQNISNVLQAKTDGANLDISNAIFTNKNFPVKNEFSRVAKQFYNADINPMNFKNPTQAADIINKYVAKATRNRIPLLVGPDDLVNAQLILTSVLYFKGQWSLPFNKSATHKDIFYDESNNKLGEVDMMYQVGPFPYYRMVELKAHLLELPYGNDRKRSMIVVLPFKKQSITNVLALMAKMPFNKITQTLRDSEIQFGDEEVYVYLPKFSISSDFTLNRALDKMGVKEVFDPDTANLLGIFPHYLYLSRLVQKADIDVDEEGTIASAAAAASITYKTEPPKFRANKPFLYFIVDKISGSIVFAGKVSNPVK